MNTNHAAEKDLRKCRVGDERPYFNGQVVFFLYNTCLVMKFMVPKKSMECITISTFTITEYIYLMFAARIIYSYSISGYPGVAQCCGLSFI